MRPQTLAEVAEMAGAGEPFDYCLANFLDDFYLAPRFEALAAEPLLLAAKFGEVGQIEDAYLAATAEELAERCSVECPEWTTGPGRALHRPWFASDLAALRAVLILESPAPFRARNLFVSENALSRA